MAASFSCSLLSYSLILVYTNPSVKSILHAFWKRSENFYLPGIIDSFFNKGAFRTHCKSDVAAANRHQAITRSNVKNPII